MKIVDINGKEREINSLKKIIHKVPDKITHELVDTDFIEVEIQGKHRKWTEWYPLPDFKKYNPGYKYE